MLASSPGWTIRKAFEVFLVANRDYWRPNDTFQSAGLGVCQASNWLGYDSLAVKAALNAVGVQPNNCTSTTSEPTELSNNQPVAVSGVEKAYLRYFIDVPAGASQLTITTTGNNGDADLYIKHNGRPSESSYDCASNGPDSNETCTFQNPPAGQWQILVHAWAAISNIQLTASYSTDTGGSNNVADLSVELIGNDGTTQQASNGQLYVRYTARVSNQGPDTAQDVVLDNEFPAGVFPISVTTPLGQCSDDGTTCEIGDLQRFQAIDVDIVVAVTDKNRLEFSATANSTSDDPDTTNNTASQRFGGALGHLLLGLCLLTLRRLKRTIIH